MKEVTSAVFLSLYLFLGAQFANAAPAPSTLAETRESENMKNPIVHDTF
jgi:hypothetical protein